MWHTNGTQNSGSIMKTFKTKAGTELPVMDLKGKDYLQVAFRVVWYREENPQGTISTELVKLEDAYAIFKATVSHGPLVIATAHGREDLKHFADYIEKAETKAIGRALALCGYGTQFAPELDEEKRIVDSPQQRPQARQTPNAQPAQQPNPIGVLLKEKGWTPQQAQEFIFNAYGVKASPDLTPADRENFTQVIKVSPVEEALATAFALRKKREADAAEVSLRGK